MNNRLDLGLSLRATVPAPAHPAGAGSRNPGMTQGLPVLA